MSLFCPDCGNVAEKCACDESGDYAPEGTGVDLLDVMQAGNQDTEPGDDEELLDPDEEDDEE